MSRRFALIHGKAEEKLKLFKDNTFHTAITSPPYWQLRDYFVDGQLGRESTPEEYVENLVSICREVKRVLRKDGTFWLNIGDGYNSGSDFSRIKKKDLIGLPWMTAFALRADGWYLRCDIIWCLSGGAEVYIKSGDKEFPTSVKDLYRLESSTIKLWNGEKWTQMVGMTKNPQKHNEIQFTLRSGERICCTPNHRWPTEKGIKRTEDLVVGDVLKTCSLPEPENCSVPDLLPDDEIGWFIGIYLAEGSRSGKTIQISSHKKEIERFEKLNKIAEKYHGICHKYDTSDNGMTINIHSDVLNSVINMYIGGRVAKDKYLSSLCWQRNNIFLRNVLEGYIEGDGHHDVKNNRYRLGFTRNYCLERSLRTICSRLNIFCTIELAHSKIKEKIYKTFKGEIRFNKNGHLNCKNNSEIIKIENDKGGREYFYDIEVEDDPNLFALSSGILTHNSKSNPMPDGAKDRPTRGHEYIFLLTKSPNYFYDYYKVLEDTEKQPERMMSFGANEQEGTFRQDQDRVFEHYGKRNRRSVWKTSVANFRGKHYATFPLDLIEPCVRASVSEKGCCPRCMSPWKRIFGKYKEPSNNEKGYILRLESKGWEPTCKCGLQEKESCIVLDPFSGMGTTGLAAIHEWQDYVGIELNKKYLDISRDRLKSLGTKRIDNVLFTGENDNFIERFLV